MDEENIERLKSGIVDVEGLLLVLRRTDGDKTTQ